MDYKKIIKIALMVIVLGLAVFLCVRYAVPLAKLLVTEEGREQICESVRNYGAFAPVIFMLLMAVQIVIAFIPGGPLELIGGMLFGGWLGLLYTVAGAVLGTLAVFFLVKCFGRPLVHLFVSEEKLQSFKFLQNEEKLELWVFILFLIPGIPKDMLTYLVPLTPMKGKHFIPLSVLARFPSLAASVLVGDSLADGRYRMCVVICVIAAVLCFVGYRLKNRLMRQKTKGDNE
ncbi:MAG: TVP38/TMEM64 family protein [Oscillospiraceae bacterium]|nr:TVP38/TMEM64 family protein [Oscillospiraceae bacterium]